MAAMRLEIVTAERVVYSEDVDALVAPGASGELGVLPGHAPMLTTLAPGEMKVTRDGEESFMAVTGGFLEVLANKVTVLADAAEYAEEIDEERAEAALERAQERVESAVSDMDLERALASMRRSSARLGVARRRRRLPRPDRAGAPGGSSG